MRCLKLVILLSFISSFVQAEGIDVSSLQSGEVQLGEWNGFRVLVYKRSNDDVAALQNREVNFSKAFHYDVLTKVARSYGNDFASSLMHGSSGLEGLALRSRRDDVVVLLGLSTFFQCAINFIEEERVFTDPCSNTKYSLDGRIINPNTREGYHLLIPPHYYEKGHLFIGSKSTEDISVVDFSPDLKSLNISTNDKLLEALQWQKYNLVRSILEDSINSNYEIATGATALHVAAASAPPSIIEILVKTGFEVNHITKGGVTPIQLALLSQKNENIVELLKHSAITSEFCNGNRCTKSAFSFLTGFHSDLTKAEFLELINGAELREAQE